MLVDILANATKYAFDERLENKPRVKIWSNPLIKQEKESNCIFVMTGYLQNDWEIWMENSLQKSKERHFGLGIQLSKSFWIFIILNIIFLTLA